MKTKRIGPHPEILIDALPARAAREIRSAQKRGLAFVQAGIKADALRFSEDGSELLPTDKLEPWCKTIGPDSITGAAALVRAGQKQISLTEFVRRSDSRGRFPLRLKAGTFEAAISAPRHFTREQAKRFGSEITQTLLHLLHTIETEDRIKMILEVLHAEPAVSKEHPTWKRPAIHEEIADRLRFKYPTITPRMIRRFLENPVAALLKEAKSA